MEHRLKASIVFIGLIAFGCGSYFPPSPTNRKVSSSDLIGKWSYRPIGGNANVNITLKSDNTFVQVVHLQSKELKQIGKWKIVGSYVELNDVLMNHQGWEIDTIDKWRIIDRDESPSGYAIFGGHVDPDCWVVFDYIGS